MASSFSQGLAFISSKPERTMTFTSSPPRRRAVRQQSIAVLPPPSTITRRPIFSTWPNETEASHSMRAVVLEVGGDALETADRNRGFFDAAAAACRFAWTIAGASQNSGKHIRSPIDHIGVAITPLGNQTDVLGNWRVRGTGPLAI